MESITFYQHIKRQTLWEQLDQRGDTLRRLMSQSNEQHITPCDTHFIVPEPQRETCPFKLLSLKKYLCVTVKEKWNPLDQSSLYE